MPGARIEGSLPSSARRDARSRPPRAHSRQRRAALVPHRSDSTPASARSRSSRSSGPSQSPRAAALLATCSGRLAPIRMLATPGRPPSQVMASSRAVGSCGAVFNQIADLVGGGHRKGPPPVDGREDLRVKSARNQDEVHRARTFIQFPTTDQPALFGPGSELVYAASWFIGNSSPGTMISGAGGRYPSALCGRIVL